jgi:predicted nucleic acid-binding protein
MGPSADKPLFHPWTLNTVRPRSDRVRAAGGPRVHRVTDGAIRAQIVAALGAGRLTATTTVEVIQEFVQVRGRRRFRGDAAALGADIATFLSPLLPVGIDDLRAGLEIWKEQDRIGAFDAVLAGTAMSVGASLVSADRAYATIAGLVHCLPDALELDT